MSLLSSISHPRDLDALSLPQLEALASEIRSFLVENVARSGGHLGPNLGVVELTLAIHRVFDSPNDPVVFDTGHQSYVHKLVTGRQDFSRLRSRGGLAGYPQRSESEHDVVESSHASSSLSWADGISRAFARTGRTDRHVVAVVGDGSLTGGMTWEALNNISDDNDRNLVIVVNDNGRSYAPTIGGMARFLNKVRTTEGYRSLHEGSASLFGRLGPAARAVYRGLRGGTHGFLSRFVNNEALYSNLDIKYLGPVDGHDLEAMIETLRLAKSYGAPVIVHAITEKGRGYAPARLDEADQFHAVGKIDPATGRPVSSGSTISWTDVFAEELVSAGERRSDVVAITAAMLRPTGLLPFAQRFPDRVLDVGIAEQHAVAASAGLAFGGLHPVVAIYATFMNRAFDQMMMDVALHRAGVTFVLDRAGVTGPDGPSHHGIWDLAMLQLVPGVRIAAPRDAERLREVFREAVQIEDAPTVVRYPKGSVGDELPAVERLDDGTDVLVRGESDDVLIVGIGPMARLGVDVAERLRAQGIGATVIDPRWVVPVARSVVDLAAEHRLVITIEDGIRVGGIGTRIRQVLREAGIDTAVDELGLPDEFIDHAERDEILEDAGLTAAKIAHDVVAQVLGTRIPIARPSADAESDWPDAADAPDRAEAADGERQSRGR
ncbi:1-deoxy-D-xylulose-5-phosphate synthase [Microbacterium paludicola]|uniref:1-deoxy-D-xylulose-5-phosphate synthase n=1 Tax=Microbacterium paludicola TaxID=300019 RepID=A0ABU1HWQ9_9MICO|nr:1-deoxy-D-xylulose-5-phosphate synthase [Microbacterium paludicola]MDR6166090.1 1-deoxy-D-xylulose-5-phosphate synthase [Microbacterium paludicola]